jgi:hypothetical protein
MSVCLSVSACLPVYLPVCLPCLYARSSIPNVCLCVVCLCVLCVCLCVCVCVCVCVSRIFRVGRRRSRLALTKRTPGMCAYRKAPGTSNGCHSPRVHTCALHTLITCHISLAYPMPVNGRVYRAPTFVFIRCSQTSMLIFERTH